MAALPDRFRIDDLLVDLVEFRVYRAGVHLPLPKLSFDLLVALAQFAPRLVSLDGLARSVWAGLVVNRETVSQRVKLLRDALGEKKRSPRYIQSVRGRGYRLLAEVVPMVEPETASTDSAPDANLLPLPDKPSLAVLPFIHPARDAGEEFFVDGVTDEIVTALARFSSLFVIAYSATRSLKGKMLAPRDIGRRLGVRYILEGSIRRDESTVHVGVKLTDSQSDAQIWAERIDERMADIFALQDRVALRVAGAIEPAIQAAELHRVRRKPVASLGCYDLYLRAAHLRGTILREQVFDALKLLESALALDPEFAPALAQAAGCHSQMYYYRWADDFEAHRSKGLVMAERAVRSGADDATVLAQVAGAIMDLDTNVDRAVGLVDRATTLNPGLAYAWFISGVLQMSVGHIAVAMEQLKRAARLDPISRLNDIAHAHVGVCLALLGEFDESLRVFRTTTYRTPRLQLGLLYTCIKLELWDEVRNQLRIYEHLTDISPKAMVMQLRLASGDHDSIAAAFAQLERRANQGSLQ